MLLQYMVFWLGAAGICAMLMIIIGGFMYSTSAGNNASMEKAKSVIADALIGLLLVFNCLSITLYHQSRSNLH